MFNYGLVNNIYEVINNVIQFNKDLEEETEIVDQLSQFRHWYYIPTLNYFGPAKFIGYSNMDTSKYARGMNKNGGYAVNTLQKWFVELPSESKVSEYLLQKLRSLLSRYDKSVNKNAVIHIPKKCWEIITLYEND
ncbi:MAG: hypothetical protein H0Z35_03125 [Thermoanaerobacteraceae bacterium]|nr:hypothetical protein [Thermoanaerobacteraceae bacterium]